MVEVPGLKRLRIRAAISQRELAKVSGVAASTIARIERGEEAHLKTVRNLAKALGVQPADLMELDK